MNLVFLLGIFVLPRALSSGRAAAVMFSALVGGTSLFLYANYVGILSFLPEPSTTVGLIATLSLSDATAEFLMQLANSVLIGPFLVGALGVMMKIELIYSQNISVP